MSIFRIACAAYDEYAFAQFFNFLDLAQNCLFPGQKFKSQRAVAYTKLLFYNVGNLTWQAYTQRRHPSDCYEHWGCDARATPEDFRRTRATRQQRSKGPWRPHAGFLGRVTFQRSELVEAEVIPVFRDMDRDKKPHLIGIPELAEGEGRGRALAYIAEASQAFGTKIDVESGVIDCGA